jgi:hypothetical protein
MQQTRGSGVAPEAVSDSTEAMLVGRWKHRAGGSAGSSEQPCLYEEIMDTQTSAQGVVCVGPGLVQTATNAAAIVWRVTMSHATWIYALLSISATMGGSGGVEVKVIASLHFNGQTGWASKAFKQSS